MIDNYGPVQRKNTSIDRIALAIVLAVLLWGVSTLLDIRHFGIIHSIVVNFILLFTAEFSFEFFEGELYIRSSGWRYGLDGIFKIAVYPLAKILDIIGIRNQPILAYYMAALYIYGMLYYDWLVVDGLARIATLYILYKNRKEDM